MYQDDANEREGHELHIVEEGEEKNGSESNQSMRPPDL